MKDIDIFFFVKLFILFSFFLPGVAVHGGPEPTELLRLLDVCDLSNSYCTTPCLSPSPLTPANIPPPHQRPFPNASYLHYGLNSYLHQPSNSYVISPSTSSGAQAQPHPGPLLKPANVAFLSHNQASTSRNNPPSASNDDDDEGTAC